MRASSSERIRAFEAMNPDVTYDWKRAIAVAGELGKDLYYLVGDVVKVY
jgi:hypothetical protein